MSDRPTRLSVPACEFGLRTDPGRDPDKQVNEDSATHVETSLGLLAVVCDGMGGHAGGKEASELAVRTIVEQVEAAPPGTPQVVLFEGRNVPVLPAHDFLYDIGPQNGRAREIIVLDDLSGPFGIFVDATHSVVEIAAGDELYMMPPDEESEHSPRVAWGVFTFAERPVMLLDLARTSVH